MPAQDPRGLLRKASSRGRRASGASAHPWPPSLKLSQICALASARVSSPPRSCVRAELGAQPRSRSYLPNTAGAYFCRFSGVLTSSSWRPSVSSKVPGDEGVSAVTAGRTQPALRVAASLGQEGRVGSGVRWPGCPNSPSTGDLGASPGGPSGKPVGGPALAHCRTSAWWAQNSMPPSPAPAHRLPTASPPQAPGGTGPCSV